MGILTKSDITSFILAGKAIFTIVSQRTGTRFTYRVAKKKSGDVDIWFVSVLSMGNNEDPSSYRYIGIIKEENGLVFRHSANAQITSTSTSVVAIKWFIEVLNGLPNSSSKLPSIIEFYHAGRCGKCGRLLTDPKSIESGYGPECSRHKR